jgi:hypothetical protein
MQGNTKGSIITGTHANENYAREINQLFSIGLNRLWPDGTLILDSHGNLVPTYNQNVVNGFAQTFTGWNYYQANQGNGRLPTGFSPAVNYTNVMVLVPSRHDLNSKLLLDNVTLPPALGLATNTALTNFDFYCSQDLEQGLDAIFYNQNVGPFICRQLIQRLVTSNPSRDYIYRVAQKFNDNGSGVRGDMQAVVAAILLDVEARGTNSLVAATFGKQREPLLRVTAMSRALPAPPTLAGTYLQSGTQTNVITMSAPHRLFSNDVVTLSFTDGSGNPAPPNLDYAVNVTGPNTFTLIEPNVSAGTYSQNTNVITLNISGHGLAVGNRAYLTFPNGGPTNGLYQVAAVNSSSSFTVAAADGSVLSGNCLLAKITAGGFLQTGTNITVSCAGPHGLNPGDLISTVFGTGVPADGQYTVQTVPDATHFTLFATNTVTTELGSSFSVYPYVAPALNRSGNVTIQWSTWNLGYTDNGGTFNLSQSPLSPPTVFNFFFPGYEFPGALASAGLTTPEFQLTSDTSVALQMNFLEGGILSGNNTNGLSSFNNNGGAIFLDIGPWMTLTYTNVPVLVDSMNSLLVAGQLSAAAKSNIVRYVTNVVNFPMSSPPSQKQMRDRVRAVVHLVTTSPDFTIQK